MSTTATKTDLNDLEKRLDKRFENIEKRFDSLMSTMSGFANDVDSRFNAVEDKLSEHDEQFRKLNKKYDHLISTIDGFIGRIDNYETELAARDHKIERLERWIQQVAAKTEVELS